MILSIDVTIFAFELLKNLPFLTCAFVWSDAEDELGKRKVDEWKEEE